MKKPLEAALRDLLKRYEETSRWERITALEHALGEEWLANEQAKDERLRVIEARDVLLEARL